MNYLSNNPETAAEMLGECGYKNAGDMIRDLFPEELVSHCGGSLPAPVSALELEKRLAAMASSCSAGGLVNFLGAGVYDRYIPAAVEKIVSLPGFLTSYTPYQPEIAQGTLQALFEFQTAVSEMTGMECSNASMYDGPTALAEAVVTAKTIKHGSNIIICNPLNPLYYAVLSTYCRYHGIEIRRPGAGGCVFSPVSLGAADEGTIALIVQQRNFLGIAEDLASAAAHPVFKNLVKIAVFDLFASSVLEPPGSFGFDIAVGDCQSIGLPMSAGGPSCGYFAVKREHIRKMPGRIVGRTLREDGSPGYVLTLQTREQHIRRERAGSNICTSSVLGAVAVLVYSSLLGADGLREAINISRANLLYFMKKAERLSKFTLPYAGLACLTETVLRSEIPAAAVNGILREAGFSGGVDIGALSGSPGNDLLFAFTEKRTRGEIDGLIEALESV